MAARPAANLDQFEAYFQRADLDRDGRISGAEAVAFFQGSNLPKNVLAQIWMHSDKNNTGFLGRAEFYNALRLVTVAQSGRELTREIIKSALEGPVAAKIPAPRINPVASAVPPVNPMSAPRPQTNAVMPSVSQVGSVSSMPFQTPGFQVPGSQVPPSMSANGQYMRPPLQTPPASSSFPTQLGNQGFPGGMAGPRLPSSNMTNMSNDWYGGRGGGGMAQTSNRSITNLDGFAPSLSGPSNSIPQRLPATSLQITTVPPTTSNTPSTLADKDSKALVVSGNGFFSDSSFGGDVFSATQSKQGGSSFNFSANSSVAASNATGPQLLTQPAQVGSSRSMSPLVVGSNPLQQDQSRSRQYQLGSLPGSSAPAPGAGVGPPGSNLTESQVSWPKMTQANIQKYKKVFVEVDKDRDGKITGEEARNLFLSWRLPRDVLKQVWDLSDQDSDSMLSLREFCIALYMMERYREGRSLPTMLPNSVKFDEALLQATSQTPVAYNNLAWQPNPGFSQQPLPTSNPVTTAPVSNLVMTAPVPNPPQKVPTSSQNDDPFKFLQRPTPPAEEKQLPDQLSNGEQNDFTGNSKDATLADAKGHGIDNEIMDSKEKMEYYRSKMQDLVLYKSRCDNRLNEITEKASADKREVETLGKKYEEKYKQVGDIASKLTIEEASFRDVQERKLELHNAIVKMAQGGSADGLLQVRVDRIHSDLEELAKALHNRCKKHGINVKSNTMIDIPFGWQPGIPEEASDWDEDWDKFEDDGFMVVKELTVDAENGGAVASSDKTNMSHAPLDTEVERHPNLFNQEIESESAYASEDASVRSAPFSPPGTSVPDSPSQNFRSTHFGKLDDSFHAADNQSDHGAARSSVSDDKFADEISWGATFDTSDVDSVWGFDTSKESGYERNKQDSFDSGEFGLDPIKTGSPSEASGFGKERSPFFSDSVPESPLYNSGPSPRFNDGLDNSFDTFGRFDSFRSNQGNLTRFDSMRSTADFDTSGFFSQNDKLTRFDSIRSTSDSNHSRGFTSFDDSDPFGTGPFKSSANSTTGRSSDSWNAS